MENSEIIYKYRKWNNIYHQKILIDGQLYYPSPLEINDPFDLKIPVDYSLLDTELKRKQYIDRLINDAKHILIHNGINIAERKKELLWLFANKSEAMEDDFNKVNFDKTNKHFGVLSLSARWDSILMWAHYSENHSGFCVGFNKAKMIANENYGASGKVVYKNEIPSIDPSENNFIKEILVKTFTKALDWNYEEEFRFCKIWEDRIATIEDRTIKFESGLIEEIILGLLISNEDKEAIMIIAKNNGIPVYQIQKKRKTLMLERVRLN